ncbi:hypothetical protein EYF80_013343 [Liparis tanakae]|uniref:Uncharacterized protein n=1 Tax=Liparis tanakae TaxID=230148 RepID=A0A4Z2IER8_9TELE|nr:hypothetical protein EYF80_013343 [Liparis tanakae]
MEPGYLAVTGRPLYPTSRSQPTGCKLCYPLRLHLKQPHISISISLRSLSPVYHCVLHLLSKCQKECAAAASASPRVPPPPSEGGRSDLRQSVRCRANPRAARVSAAACCAARWCRLMRAASPQQRCTAVLGSLRASASEEVVYWSSR